jgi:hypothetical protein
MAANAQLPQSSNQPVHPAVSSFAEVWVSRRVGRSSAIKAKNPVGKTTHHRGLPAEANERKHLLFHACGH